MRKQDKLKGGVVYGNSNEVQRTLQQYGDRTIIAMKVIRTPISGAINRLLNWITLGKMKKLKNKHGYNDFFHLALELNLGGGRKIYLEKNERVNLSPRFSTNKKTQTMDVQVNGKPQKTVRELYETTLKKIGEYNFYQYRAFSLNCQKFIQDILRTNGFLNPKINDFIMQDVESIAKGLSGFTKRVANVATDVAGYFSKWFGRGLDDLPEDVRNALRKNQAKHKGNIERDFGADFKDGWDLATKTVGKPIMKEIHSHTKDPVSGMYLELFGKSLKKTRSLEKTANDGMSSANDRMSSAKRSRVMKMASILRGNGISKKKALEQSWKMFAYD